MDVQDVHTVTQSDESLDHFCSPQPSPTGRVQQPSWLSADSPLTLVAHANIRLFSTCWVSYTSRKSTSWRKAGFPQSWESLCANKFVLDYGHPLGTVQVSYWDDWDEGKTSHFYSTFDFPRILTMFFRFYSKQRHQISTDVFASDSALKALPWIEPASWTGRWRPEKLKQRKQRGCALLPSCAS